MKIGVTVTEMKYKSDETVDTLDKLVEIVGKRMKHYHDFRRELAALKIAEDKIQEQAKEISYLQARITRLEVPLDEGHPIADAVQDLIRYIESDEDE